VDLGRYIAHACACVCLYLVPFEETTIKKKLYVSDLCNYTHVNKIDCSSFETNFVYVYIFFFIFGRVRRKKIDYFVFACVVTRIDVFFSRSHHHILYQIILRTWRSAVTSQYGSVSNNFFCVDDGTDEQHIFSSQNSYDFFFFRGTHLMSF